MGVKGAYAWVDIRGKVSSPPRIVLEGSGGVESVRRRGIALAGYTTCIKYQNTKKGCGSSYSAIIGIIFHQLSVKPFLLF